MPAQQLSPEPLGVTLCKKQKGKAWRWPWLCLICSFHNCLSPEATISLFLGPAVKYFGIGTTALMKYISAPSQPHFNHHHGLQGTTASFALHKNHLQVSPIPYSIFNPKNSFCPHASPGDSAGGLSHLQCCWGMSEQRDKSLSWLSLCQGSQFSVPPHLSGCKQDGESRALRAQPQPCILPTLIKPWAVAFH